jgi:hypothetical protein
MICISKLLDHFKIRYVSFKTFIQDLKDGLTMVVSVAEFATLSPILSFGCVSAGKRMVKQTAEGVEVSMEEYMIENNDKQEKTVVRLYFVQPKSLQ